MESYQEGKSASLSQKHSKEALWAGITSAANTEASTNVQTMDENSALSVNASERIEANEISGSEVTVVPGKVELIEASKSGTPCPPFSPKKTVLAPTVSATLSDDTPATNILSEASLAPVVLELSDVSGSTDELTSTGQLVKIDRFPHNLLEKLGISINSQNGKAYIVIKGAANSNSHAIPLGGKKANNLIRELALNDGIKLRKSDITDLNSHLQAQAENAYILKDIWYRTAPVQGGICIDLGNDQHTHVMITAGKVEIVSNNSPMLFHRTSMTMPMVMPAAVGNLNLLKKYLNLHPVQTLLYVAWLSYTLAHPKVSTSKYVILVLKGDQGSGKSQLCKVTKSIIDPSKVTLQVLPNTPKDIGIAAQNVHVLCYDNVREFSQLISDLLCVASTGGAMCQRQLYTDDEQNVLNIHVTMILNGIHSFIGQPDLAQRTLPLDLLALTGSKYKSEAEFMREFQNDLPVILRGLFDLIADIFTHLPNAVVTNHERMIEFVQWLAALELVHGCPVGTYQEEYSAVLNQGQLDSILDNTLAAVVLEFAHGHINGEWSGTPSELFVALNSLVSMETQRTREWPKTVISMSKRLTGIKASLRTQGVFVEHSRGKDRTITITSTVIIKPTNTINLPATTKAKGRIDEF